MRAKQFIWSKLYIGIYNGFEFHFDLVPKHDICILGPDLLCPQKYSIINNSDLPDKY